MFSRRWRIVACLVLACTAAPGMAGQKTDKVSLVDKEVITTKRVVDMFEKPDGAKVVYSAKAWTLWIEEVSGDYLLVRRDGRKGWVKRSDVVSQDEAVAYFAERIKAN